MMVDRKQTTAYCGIIMMHKYGITRR